MLSAFFLLLAVMLAGGYGPPTAQIASAPAASQSSPADLGAGGHRPIPLVSKQQMLAGEVRDLKAASSDDGKPKAFLPAKAFELTAAPVGTNHAPQAGAFVDSTAASPFDARAPPARS